MELFWVAFVALFVLFLVLFVTIFVYLIHSGLFTRVTVGAGKPPIANIYFAYKFGRGPYKDVGAVFTEVTSLAPKLRCLGVYYDDPKEVPAHELRWAVGSILSEGEEKPDPELEEAFRKENYKVLEFPAVTNAVCSSFPYHNMMCLFIAIYRVYPRLAEYVKTYKLCAHPFLEIYEGNMMYFMAPLSKQDQFYVPETEPEYEDEGDEPFAGPSEPPPGDEKLSESPLEDLQRMASAGSAEQPPVAAASASQSFTNITPEAPSDAEKSVEEVLPIVKEPDTPVHKSEPENAPVEDQVVPDDNKESVEDKNILSSEPTASAIDEVQQAVAAEMPKENDPLVDLDASMSSTGHSVSTEGSEGSVGTATETSFISSGLSESSCILSDTTPTGFSSDSCDGNETETSSFEEMTKEELQE